VLGDQAAAVRAAIAADEADRPGIVPANWDPKPERQTTMDFAGIASEEYVSPVTGAKEVRWLGTPVTLRAIPVLWKTRATLQLARPRAYWVPPTRPEVIRRLELHGIAFERLDQPRTVAVDLYRLVEPRVAGTAFEGRHTVTARVAAESRRETFPAGSVRVPTDQPLGELAMLLLEPECRDSLLAWGFFPEILQQTEYIEGYVMAPLAEQMLAADPALRAEFEARLRDDPAFARDRAARLRWFYERTRYQDDRHLLYPVGVER
jgi:hypothetical protein